MREKNKEIILWKTIFMSMWIYMMMGLLFIPAIFYARDMIILNSTDVGAVGFWGLMLIFLVLKFGNMLIGCTFYVYKKDANVLEDEA